MIYGDKVRFVRDRLGMSRMDFAVFLGSSEGYIRNVENAKEGKEIRFSREREEKLTKEASLPPGFFVDGDINVEKIEESHDELFYRLFPGAKENNVDREDVLNFIKTISKFKSGT